jgi:hypothetical protein
MARPTQPKKPDKDVTLQQYVTWAREWADKIGLPRDIIDHAMTKEMGGRGSHSPEQAAQYINNKNTRYGVGGLQVQEVTQQHTAEMIKKGKFPWQEGLPMDRHNPEANAKMAVTYMKYLHDKMKDDTVNGQKNATLLAYNMGPAKYNKLIAEGKRPKDYLSLRDEIKPNGTDLREASWIARRMGEDKSSTIIAAATPTTPKAKASGNSARFDALSHKPEPLTGTGFKLGDAIKTGVKIDVKIDDVFGNTHATPVRSDAPIPTGTTDKAANTTPVPTPEPTPEPATQNTIQNADVTPTVMEQAKPTKSAPSPAFA